VGSHGFGLFSNPMNYISNKFLLLRSLLLKFRCLTKRQSLRKSRNSSFFFTANRSPQKCNSLHDSQPPSDVHRVCWLYRQVLGSRIRRQHSSLQRTQSFCFCCQVLQGTRQVLTLELKKHWVFSTYLLF